MSNDQVLSAEQRTRVIVSMYKHTLKQRSEYLKFMINEQKIDEWYVMIEGMFGANDEFKHGQYLVRIVLPPAFPYKPPQFFFMTPNGVYDIGVKVCVSIGEYHSQNYPSAQKVLGFVSNLVSGIIGWTDLGGGINILSTDVPTKRALARASAQYNQTHYAKLVDEINKNFASYSADWPPLTTTMAATTATTTTTTTTTAPATASTTSMATANDTSADNVPTADAPSTDGTVATPTTAQPRRVARPARRKLGDV